MPAAVDIQGVTCDLLTALVDSWTLWERQISVSFPLS